MTWNEEPKKEEESTPIEFKSLSNAEQKRGLKIGIYGDFSTGKTHFCLTAPEPIFILDTEMGVSPLAHLFPDKDIKILDIREEDGSDSYKKYIAAIDFLSKQEKVGTIIVDSITDVWSFCQEYGKVEIFKIKPEQRLAQQWDWGVINKLYLQPLLKLMTIPCNLILTARASEVYAGAGNPTGILSPSWMKKTPFWVDLVIYNTHKQDKLKGNIFNSRIEKCRQYGSLMGKTFTNLDFITLQSEINKLKEVK